MIEVWAKFCGGGAARERVSMLVSSSSTVQQRSHHSTAGRPRTHFFKSKSKRHQTKRDTILQYAPSTVSTVHSILLWRTRLFLGFNVGAVDSSSNSPVGRKRNNGRHFLTGY